MPLSIAEHAEADTFFCFTNLMAEIRDNFIKSLDDSQCGITYKMEKVYSTLKEKDVELYLKLVRTGTRAHGQDTQAGDTVLLPSVWGWKWLQLSSVGQYMGYCPSSREH